MRYGPNIVAQIAILQPDTVPEKTNEMVQASLSEATKNRPLIERNSPNLSGKAPLQRALNPFINMKAKMHWYERAALFLAYLL